MNINCDVLVVGAGPAGSSAAFFLKQFDKEGNLNVDLVDKLKPAEYSLYHDMCGEGVSARVLDDISPLKPQGIIDKIRLIREFYPGDIEIKTKMDGLLIDRPKFFKSIIDEFIRLGGNFIENSTLEDFYQKDDKVKVKVNGKFKEYDYVIAADGANSIFRKKLGISGNTKSLIQYIVDKEPEAQTIKFYYDEKYEGDYMWEFPHGDNVKIGYPVLKGKISKPQGKIILKQARLVGYGGVERYTHGRILLVGDAACQTNPITKGGIRSGMNAGKMAAKAVINKMPSQYESEWLKTKFSSNLLNKAFKQLQQMNNKELEDHVTPFKNVDLDDSISRSISNINVGLFYRKYIKLYQAYEICNKYGW